MKMFVEPKAVYLHRDFVDFRKAINGLAAMVEDELPLMSGALFVFCNKGRDKLKILYWDKTGFALWHKRLEKDKFKWPTQLPDVHIELNEAHLHWLLSGFDVAGHKEVSYQTTC